MAVLRNYRDPAVNLFRKQFNEAAQWWGEPAVLFSMWNPQNVQNQDLPIAHCPHCWDDDYGQSNTSGGICPYCFGTGFTGGIRKAWFTNVIRTNPSQTNKIDKLQGHLAGEEATMQAPWQADLWEKDFVLFVNGWEETDVSGIYAPLVQEAWQIAAPPQVKNIKDGSSNYSKMVKICSKCDIKRVNMNHPIMNVEWAALPQLNSDAFFVPTPKGEDSMGALLASSITSLNS